MVSNLLWTTQSITSNLGNLAFQDWSQISFPGFDRLSRFFFQDLGQIDKFPIEANMGLFGLPAVCLPVVGTRELIYWEKSNKCDQCDYTHLLGQEPFENAQWRKVKQLVGLPVVVVGTGALIYCGTLSFHSRPPDTSILLG